MNIARLTVQSNQAPEEDFVRTAFPFLNCADPNLTTESFGMINAGNKISCLHMKCVTCVRLKAQNALLTTCNSHP